MTTIETIDVTVCDRADKSDPLNLLTVVYAQVLRRDGAVHRYRAEVERYLPNGRPQEPAEITARCIEALVRKIDSGAEQSLVDD